jgi:peptidoglycan hydrolase CwlO-like protein|tara:strand:+ start:237 stop:587 length:351 start_codon:yes stop_codon:yes gene_type:complete
MGEGRGKLEGLIGDLESKKAELEQLIQEYELMLPHLSKARDALDEAGITDTGPAQPAPEAPAPQPAAAAPEPESAPAAEAAPEAEPAADEAEAAPARRSIASLVAEDDAPGDEATH